MITNELLQFHPNDLLYTHESCWQPDPGATGPGMPGQHVMTPQLKPAATGLTCFCGSNRPFSTCCSRQPYWIPVCINPDFQGYSKLEMHTATYRIDDADRVKAALLNDARFRCTDNHDLSSHWLFHADSPYRFTDAGEISLGDLELLPAGILRASAMSRARMTALRTILAGMGLTSPQVQTIQVRGLIPKPLHLADLLPHPRNSAVASRKIPRH